MTKIDNHELTIQDTKEPDKIYSGYTMEDKRFIEDTYEVLFSGQQSQFKPSTEYLLTFKYQGMISLGNFGVYACIDPRFKKTHNLGVKNIVTIEDEEMKDKIIENTIICVQSEPAYARYLLPCFDEPCMKATFKCKVLVSHKTHIALSNTEGKEVVDEEGRWFHFTESPKMCTYLICIVVGKFDYHEVKTKRGIKIRGYTPQGQANQVQEHVEIAADAVDLYEEYFGIPYPLEKLDFVSFHNHMVRAMENWGIITIKNDVILNHPDYTSSKTIQRNARTVAHEVSHMWFGNHVSPEWWDVIWLNEGFARYAEHQILNKIRPNFRIWDKYMFEVYGSAIRADKHLYSTHPVHVPVPEPNKLMQIFDTISYAKGSAICRMLNGIINDDNVFQSALKEYMLKYAGQCTITEDLLEVFEKVSGKPIKKLLIPWIEQPCFPQVYFKRVSDDEFEVEQQCFQGQSQSIWPLYIQFQSSKGISGQFTMLEKQYKLKIDGLTKDDVVKFNKDHKGFFICNYDEEYQNQLLSNNQKFSIFDRFGILFDRIELQGRLRIQELVHFKGETSFGAWSLMYQSLNKVLGTYLKNPQVNEQDYLVAKDIVKYNFEQVIKEKEIDYQLLNIHLMFLGIGCMDKSVIEFCQQEFKEKFDPQTLKCSIDNDIRFPVYCLSAFSNDQYAQILRNYYDQKIQFFNEFGLDQEKDNVFYALLLSYKYSLKQDLDIKFYPNIGSEISYAYLRISCLTFTSILETLNDEEIKSEEFKEYVKRQTAYVTRFYSFSPQIDIENSQKLFQLISKLLEREEFQSHQGFDTLFAQLKAIVGSDTEAQENQVE